MRFKSLGAVQLALSSRDPYPNCWIALLVTWDLNSLRHQQIFTQRDGWARILLAFAGPGLNMYA